jgi:formylmethanofuran dehydrogenase subunit E
MSVSAQPQDEWWAPDWLTKSAYSPSFAVRDTVNKYGRYADKTKPIALGDLIKFHGHFCGGLVESAGALRLAFDSLFPNGEIDRTDLRIASSNSACGGDVAAYLTGARARFGSHLIDPKLTESEFVVQQVSTGKTVRVRVRPEAYPTNVRTQMRKIESGNFEPKDIDIFQDLQWAYAKKIVTRPLGETFVLLDSAGYVWPEAPCKEFGSRKDNAYKTVPEK